MSSTAVRPSRPQSSSNKQQGKNGATPKRAQQVYDFADYQKALRTAGSADALRGLLGGKGANLAEMNSLGLPIPNGFVITTEACKAYLASKGKFPPGMWEEVTAALKKLEKATGKKLGDPKQPLLVSCRSGAKFSMPGMMDTVLNIGMTDEVAASLAEKTGDERFAFDSYRRLVQMYGRVVLGVPDEAFDVPLQKARAARRVDNDAELPAEDLRMLTAQFKDVVKQHTKKPFPSDPMEQLRLAIEAVFDSWNGKRAFDYRKAAGIPHDLGTAVNIVTMVFGNMGERSATGVATTRDVTTGAPEIEGDFLINAQGEDVVNGTRTPLRIAEMAIWAPKLWKEFQRYCVLLEKHYRDVQDVEFTVEDGKLWMLQTRNAKRTAQAAIRIAVDLARQKRITKEEAVLRVSPEHVDYFLHPQFDAAARAEAAKAGGALLAKGLNVSPGAAIGQVAFDADLAEEWAKKEGKQVILVRLETKPDDVHGMLAAQGVVTSRGGRTSHAALVARQFGKPAVVGALSLEVDVEARRMSGQGGVVVHEGEWVSIDGTTGEVFLGKLPTVVPDVADEHLLQLLSWADAARDLGVWANSDYGRDAERARRFGAEGIGLCRTEHMFFEADRLPIVQAMILAKDEDERAEHLQKLLPLQRSDFAELFRAMDGLPVTIRLIDPPLHEFLPDHDRLMRETTELLTRLELHAGDESAMTTSLREHQKMLAKVDDLREQNPMLGLRGVRLGIHMPDLVRMQVRAIFEAACDQAASGVVVHPKIMIPLTTTAEELNVERGILEKEAKAVMKEQGCKVKYQFGTMIEIPRAALVADRLAEHAEFFSFGTNDLTQTTFGISRDDAETGFLTEYLQKGILADNPFATIDQDGVGQLMRWAIEKARTTRADIDTGICGEHGGDPRTIAFCDRIGLDYVSCSPFRIPIARLAAAQAALLRKAKADKVVTPAKALPKKAAAKK
ncbi:MAG: pyruvate, phosphate dikinase [Planctomycetes bacterium]|nr:pyruvate, phosphate dikinase [Planctomycetota bacterium]